MGLRFRIPTNLELHATRLGIVVTGGRSPLRIDLGHRDFEAEVVSILRDDRSLETLHERYDAASVRRALKALKESGAMMVDDRVPVVDLLRDASKGERPCVLISTADDPRLETVLLAGADLLLIAVAPARVLVLRHAPAIGPCARCALLFDVTAYRRALPGRLVDPVSEASVSARPGIQVAHRFAVSMAEALRERKTWPAPGRARILDVPTAIAERAFRSHPMCPNHCRGEASEPVDLHGPFSPILQVEGRSDDEPARVMFRRARSPWRVRAADFGAATAFGDDAEVRATAEAIERFCMHHHPPDVVDESAEALGSSAALIDDIAQLCFEPSAHAAPGFRHPRFDSHLRLDWCWAQRIDDGERRLFPASLVGRGRDGATALVDASSNGYAAHTSRDVAILNGLLEVVERDAILTWWYLGTTPPRIAAPAIEGARTVAFLATRDIDLPVVWILAELDDGSVRSSGGAGVGFARAYHRAVAEMRSSLAKRPVLSDRSSPNLDASGRHGPSDHLRYYMVAERCGPVLERMRAEPELTIESLESRWPNEGDLAEAVRALSAEGLSAWSVDRSLPDLFGASWHVARVVVPGTIELSWGQAYPRLASPRVSKEALCPWPHPIS